MEILFILPVLIAALVTVVLAPQNKEAKIEQAVKFITYLNILKYFRFKPAVCDNFAQRAHPGNTGIGIDVMRIYEDCLIT